MSGRSFKFFIFFFFLIFSYVKATHNRAGEITYKRIAPFTAIRAGVVIQVYTYSITVIKYTDDGAGIADRCVDTVYFGDNTRGVAPRENGSVCPPSNQCGFLNNKAITCGSIIITDGSYRVKKNVYSIIHTYPGPGDYLIRTFDPNRNGGVYNIPNSINIPFYIESKLIINSFTGANSSPVFAFAPIDRACFNVCFEHNPGAYDPDGDSLSYVITTSRGEDGQTVPLYSYPETGGGVFEIHPTTGLLKWCTPRRLGEYNIAFIVQEWRKNTSGAYQLIGYVLRDMQVIVRDCKNDPPAIVVPDICIEAGKTATANLTVSDPNAGDFVTVQGGGGAFAATSPIATFNPGSGVIDSTKGKAYNIFFSWQTTCDHIQSLPYLTTFKVEDDGHQGLQMKLVSFNTMSIKVVPPSVKNVKATPFGTDMKISWTASKCSPATNPLLGYKVYRKQDCSPFVFDPCKTGVPATSGFELIATTGPADSLITDNNKGDGLVVGQDYSYIVVAFYKDGTESFGSSQICAKLKRDVPVILNVDVKSTAATGSIWIRWARPLTDTTNLDTLKYPGPYRFTLKHRLSSATAFTDVQTFTNNLIAKIDTQYLHTNINTESGSEEYMIEFMSGTVTVGSSQKATSVFLSTVPSDRQIDLSWTSKTPWKNYKYTVMRQDSTSPAFVFIGTTTLTTFRDTINLVNGSTYCYYVISEGKYSDPKIANPLVNASQISCQKPKDLTPPTNPTITIDADCPKGTVKVSWTDVSKIPRSDDVAKYYLYYKSLVNGTYNQIATVFKNDPLEFQQDDPNSFSGCYAVRAIDIHDNVGELSQDFCIDNCPEFELPNIFTPNGDEANDFFKAIKVRMIKEINLTVLDRWGNTMFTTKDPYFQWNGVNTISKAPVSDGTYFYVCDVYEPRLKGIIKRTLKGTVHVSR